MAGYKELVEEWRLDEGDSSITGTRAFYKYSGGTASLPSIGDSFSTTYQNCILRNINHTKFFPDPDDRSEWIEKLVCNYSTQPLRSETISPDEEERRYRLGTEVITIDEPSNWKWSLKGSKCDQPLYVSNVVGSYTRQKLLTSDAAKETWLRDVVEGLSGTINAAAYEGHRIGSLLFEGVSGGTQYDENGDKVWLFEVTFTYRLIRGGPGSFDGSLWYVHDYNGAKITQDDWLYLWNRNASASGEGAWDKPVDEDGNGLYQKTNFNLII